MSTKQDVKPNYPLTPAEWLATPLGDALLEQETRIVQETIEGLPLA